MKNFDIYYNGEFVKGDYFAILKNEMSFGIFTRKEGELDHVVAIIPVGWAIIPSLDSNPYVPKK
jgi:hypothetical protein